MAVSREVIEAMEEVIEDLENIIEHTFNQIGRHEGMRRQYERDMYPVRRAREALEKLKADSN